MKNIIYIFTLVFLLVLTNQISPQSNFSIEANGGKTSNLPGKNILEHWNAGWTAGAVLNYSILPEVEFGLNASYSNLNFDESSVSLVYPAVCCYRHEIRGNNTKLFETSLSVKFFTNTKKIISPYITFKTGFYFINTGDILTSSYRLDENGNETFSGSSVYGNSGKNYFKTFAGGGVGLAVYFTDNIELRTQVLLTVALNGGQSFLPITSGLNFGF